MPKSSSPPMVPRPTTARLRRQSAERIAALRAAHHPGDLGQRPLPEATEFPRWPMLRNAERIFDALASRRDAAAGDGLVRDTQSLTMDDLSLTQRHVDLKAWMAHHHPGERPAFLFDEIGACTSSGDQPGHSGRIAGRAGSDLRRGWRTPAASRRRAPSTRRC